MNDSFIASFRSVALLTRRNVQLFFKDRLTVFFSFLSPIIILVLYLGFLRNIQMEGVRGAFPEGFAPDAKAISAFVDAWLISSILSVSALTVALNSMHVMVADRGTGKIKDFLVTPVRSWVLTISYFLSFLFVTLLVEVLMFMLACVYLVASGSWYMSTADALTAFGLLLLSCLSSVCILMLIMGFFRSQAAAGGFSGIFSALIGFITGAYMPTSSFALGMQYVMNIVPGSHSSALFRILFMRGVLAKLTDGYPPDAAAELSHAFSLRLNFFGTQIDSPVMWAYLAASVVAALALNLIVEKQKKKRMFL